MTEQLLKYFIEMNEKKAVNTAREMMTNPGEVVKVLDTCKEAMDLVGAKFENEEFFLSELICAGDIFNQIMEIVLPQLKKDSVRKVGTMVLGTVSSDVHTIGKDIFKVMAEASGIRVFDLGVDLPAEIFVEAVKKHNPDLLGMSCLITSGVEAMKVTVDALKAAGSRDNIKIIIGGGRTSESVMNYIGADAWADDAARGVRLCNELLSAKE
jgi:methanogenic corrinoid protein MtbC1